ncbi:MAG: hypothetical protein SF182_01675 [Deltaproteobacteria bacterium]|nr:hypothetical protein [Deltaproteobacteria bacterium]
MRRRVHIVAVLVALLAAPTAQAAQSYTAVNEGSQTKLATETRNQGGDTVHEEVVVTGFSLTTTKTAAPFTATGSSAAILGSATPCRGFQIQASPDNAGPIWIRRQSGATTSNSWPIFPGGIYQDAAPNSLDCADLYVIQGSGCSSDCVGWIATH